jgi:hypothetical protein
MPYFATPPLIEQWAINIGATEPIGGSWIEAIAQQYEAPEVHGDRLADIAAVLGAIIQYGDHYQSIAEKLGDETPLNGSYLERIVQLTTPA